jgi:hypothetical protein
MADKGDIDRITTWTATKLGAAAVVTICDEHQTYAVRKGVDRMKVAQTLRELAREVEETA